MARVYVAVPYMDRPDEEIGAARAAALALYERKTGDEAELSAPGGKRLTGELEAMFAADLVVTVKWWECDPVCQLVCQAANVYGKPVYEDRFIPGDFADALGGD